MKKFPVLLLLAGLCNTAFAQSTNQTKALTLKQAAVKLMDNGQTDSSLLLLRQAAALDPSNLDIPYETGYAFYLAKQPDSTVAVLTDLLKKKQDTQIYEMLGNAYDDLNQNEKAVEAYGKGLEIEPKNGRLMLNMGILFLRQDSTSRAMDWFEKGIAANPEFPSNYYWASKILAANEKYIWALLYGEIFQLNEPSGNRKNKISELMYNIYKSQITLTDSGASVKLNRQLVLNMDDLLNKKKQKNFKLPFEANYEMAVSVAVAIPAALSGQKEMSLAMVAEIRSSFIKFYYSKNMDKNYPNALLDWQKKIDDAGLTEPYSFYLMRYGNIDEFNSWVANGGEAKLHSLASFLHDNGLELNSSNYLHWGMYQ
ncbi:M48 family metallopeptidase [Chitinophaga sp. Cy-1792]|uniref:tetratricopeptide repeat protein n=1 Tax=Chitinophaga sp. Cy-1792 TaxID=2608339 RepID=UPI00141E55EE|nr:tetratricopeptide repeat protein [Chitinophaga sp. Cy-1792]NIG57673.1 hypothetical protein [Chitinophaga sp. Cy-1792]